MRLTAAGSIRHGMLLRRKRWQNETYIYVGRNGALIKIDNTPRLMIPKTDWILADDWEVILADFTIAMRNMAKNGTRWRSVPRDINAPLDKEKIYWFDGVLKSSTWDTYTRKFETAPEIASIDVDMLECTWAPFLLQPEGDMFKYAYCKDIAEHVYAAN